MLSSMYVRNILNYSMANKTAYERALLIEKTKEGNPPVSTGKKKPS